MGTVVLGVSCLPELHEIECLRAVISAMYKINTDPDAAFMAWTKGFPQKHWAKYDLAACRLGWDAALSLSKTQPGEGT